MWIQIDEKKLEGTTLTDSNVLSYLWERINHYRNINTEQAESFRALASQQYEREGELEIDDDAVVSVGPDSDGAYVQAWVWVSDDK